MVTAVAAVAAMAAMATMAAMAAGAFLAAMAAVATSSLAMFLLAMHREALLHRSTEIVRSQVVRHSLLMYLKRRGQIFRKSNRSYLVIR